MLLAEHGTFHHVYDFAYVELPRGVRLPLPFGLTKFMLLQVIAVVIVLLIFRGLAKRIRTGSTAHGWWWNFWEMLALYIRDEVVRPIIGDLLDTALGAGALFSAMSGAGPSVVAIVAQPQETQVMSALSEAVGSGVVLSPQVALTGVE